mmetsp:Transcript_27478/g.74342  ORF Transcript_27478/g.74342 Transcript_27478/m.74342 type:complete len:87 (-) Transcript_27478:8-268(-)|eukprot:1143704-Pelagomonas_calceolata.AAC.1
MSAMELGGRRAWVASTKLAAAMANGRAAWEVAAAEHEVARSLDASHLTVLLNTLGWMQDGDGELRESAFWSCRACNIVQFYSRLNR